MSNHKHEDFSFLAEMQDVTPLKAAPKVHTVQEEKSLSAQLKRQAMEKHIALDDNGLSIEKVDPVDPYDFIQFKKDGVQDGVYKNLRLGKYAIDHRLSLKGKKFDDARYEIYQTIKQCHEKGIRTLLIEHGLGLHSKPFPAFMKSYVNQWLKEIDMVIAFHTAMKQHGGLANVYVLLKKHPNQKQINREQHQRRF